MKAQTFKIVGDIRFFPQMKEDIIQLGYKLHSNSYNGKFIVTNVSQVEGSTKEEFKVLYQTDYNDKTKTEIFNLPEDYNKALDFAKEQLLDKYWVEEFKVGDYVATGTEPHPGSKIAKIIGKYATKDEYLLKYKNGNKENWGNNLRKATPAEIEEFNKIDWKKDDLAYSTILNKVLKISYVGIHGIDTRDKGDIYYDVDVKSLIKPTPEQIEEFNKPVYKAGDYVILEHNRGMAAPKNSLASITKPPYKDKYGDEVMLVKWEDRTSFSGQSDGDYEVNRFRLATPEEIKKANEPKDGDIVVSTGNKNGVLHIPKGNIGKVNTCPDSNNTWWYTITEKSGIVSYPNGLQWLGDYFRKATPVEIEQWNKKPEYVEMTVGSRNAKIKVYRDKVQLKETAHINLKFLKQAYDSYSNSFGLGSYDIHPYGIGRDNQMYLVGCSTEKNLVSLNEIKSVIETAEKL